MLNIKQFKKIAIKIYSTQKKRKKNKCRAYLTLLMLLLLPLFLKLSCLCHLTVDFMPLHRNKIGQIINEFHVLQIANWEGIIIPKEKKPLIISCCAHFMTNRFTEKKEIHPGHREIMHQHSIPDSYFWGPIKIYSSSSVNQILILKF